MEQTKKLLSLAAASALTLAANAYEYPYLTFMSADGTATSVSVESLTMNIAGDKIIVKNNETETTLALADLTKMYFSNSPTGIANVTAASNAGGIYVYSASGVLMGVFASIGQAEAALDKGVYVVKAGNVTKKTVIR